jgi:hypothetical protein
MKKIALIIIVITIACNHKKENALKKEENVLISDTTKSIKVVKNTVVSKKNFSNFSFENDTLLQKINIEFVKNNEIVFNLSSKNKKSQKTVELQGTAKLKNKGDAEFEDDEEGNAIMVTEFIYKKNTCWIGFRIDSENRSFVKLNESDCMDFNNECNLNTNFYLLKTPTK